MRATSKCRDCQFSPRCLPGLLGNHDCCKTCVYEIDCWRVHGGPEKAARRFTIALDPKVQAWVAEMQNKHMRDEDMRACLKTLRPQFLCELGHEIREKAKRWRRK